MATVVDPAKTDLLENSVGIRQAFLAAGLADQVALLAAQRADVRRHSRRAAALSAAAFGLPSGGVEKETDADMDGEMITISVGNTINYPQPEPMKQVAAALPQPSKTPSIIAEPLKPIGKLAKAGLVAAAIAATGGLGATAVGLWEMFKPPAATNLDTDTTTQYDLELVPSDPKGE